VGFYLELSLQLLPSHFSTIIFNGNYETASILMISEIIKKHEHPNSYLVSYIYASSHQAWQNNCVTGAHFVCTSVTYFHHSDK